MKRMRSTRLSRRALLTRSAQGALAMALGDSVLDATSSARAASSQAAGETIPFFTVENDPDSITWLNNAIASFRAHGHPGVKIN
jgi:ABC-type glycerol-3-phosphate transport system substrate-binding protein